MLATDHLRGPSLLSVFYVSRAKVLPEEIRRIVEKSRVSNETQGLTGGMLFTGSFFAQVLEGPAPAVEAKWSIIAADTRHDLVKPLERKNVRSRQYGKWTMGYIQAEAANGRISQLLDDSIDPAKVMQLRGLLLEWVSGGT